MAAIDRRLRQRTRRRRLTDMAAIQQNCATKDSTTKVNRHGCDRQRLRQRTRRRLTDMAAIRQRLRQRTRQRLRPAACGCLVLLLLCLATGCKHTTPYPIGIYSVPKTELPVVQPLDSTSSLVRPRRLTGRGEWPRIESPGRARHDGRQTAPSSPGATCRLTIRLTPRPLGVVIGR